MKKIFIFFLNPELLIPVLCILAVLYFGGFFKSSKKFNEYTVNVCTRSLDLNKDFIKGIKTDDGIFRFFEVCGLLKDEIENNNKPGFLSNGQEDILTNIQTKIRCLIDGPPSPKERAKFEKIKNYGERCIIDKITKLNNGKEIYNINKNLRYN